MRGCAVIKDYQHIERLQAEYAPAPIDIKKHSWIAKSQKPDDLTIITPPILMQKLIDLLKKDEYHYGCVDAISESCFIKFECQHPQAKAFFEQMQLPKNDDIISTFSDFIHYYIGTGNGFLLKMRSITGQWVGLNRLIPSEIQIAENYDTHGFLAPNYVQVKNGLKNFIPGRDMIHMLQKNSMSNAWGIACEPIIYNVETLYEIKQYDYNRFKNGLLIDHFLIVEGGSLGKPYTDSDGKEIDPISEIQSLLQSARGTPKAHSTILLEVPEPTAKVRLEPLRHGENDFGSLKKDLRDGIIVYHRVPHRLVSLQTPGKLGGDESGDMTIFYNMVIKPLQERVALMIASELNNEFGWDVKAEDFDFGDINEVLESVEMRLFR
jgi:hypothetical protein